jgi:hypothetical protein
MVGSSEVGELRRQDNICISRFIFRVPFEYARVPARDRECSEHGEDVDHGIVRQCVRREYASSFGNCRCCRSGGFTVRGITF